MPEQAILDLPVIEFELYEDSIGRLHAQCIESYRLAGFRPHPDAIFHLGASLWRYRDNETLKQVVALAACYLHALSRHVAARRRVAAVRTAMDEPDAGDMRQRLSEADEDLAGAGEELNDIANRLRDFVASYTGLQRRNLPASDERLKANLGRMGESGWTDRLETLAGEMAQVDSVRIDWSAPLSEVLEDLEALPLKAPKPSNGNGNGHGGVMERLRAELDQYRNIADRASTRLQQVDDERHQLEALLQDTESQYTNRSLALEEAREALEITLVEARERLERLERDRNRELSEAHAEIKKLRAERDQLSSELLRSLDVSTEAEVSQEELIELLESAAGDRTEAAQTLTSLSRRLEEVQNDALEAAGQLDALRDRVNELEQMLDDMRGELSRSEQRNQQAEATIRALEGDAGRSSEFESILTESEERLAETQEKLADAELRQDQLTGQLEDKDYELQRANERIEGQKKTIESISGQLAEAETLADEHEARIVVLERENERLRRDLSDAQSKMLDSKGDVDEARESARLAEIEASRLKDQLKEERGKTTSVNSESLQLQKDLRDRSEELTRLKSELEDATQRLQRFEKNAEESNRKARDLEDELARANEKAAAAAQETSRLLDELKTARDEASNHRSASEGLTRETEGQRTELEKVRAELAALQESSSRHGNQGAELRAKAVELEQQLAAMRIEKESDAELAEDRRKKLEERLDLASERAANADTERAALQEMLDRTERARAGERAELEALVERERNKTVSDEGALAQTNAQVKELQDKLNESEAFLIKRQREFERADKQLKSLLDEVRAVADLRAKYEKAKPGKKQEELASQIGRRMDSLFSAAGRPINADRRTEKLVILTVKKSDEEIEAESNKPFVATNKDEDESNEDADDEAES